MSESNTRETFEPRQEGISMAMPETFESVEAERQHRKERLAAAFRVLGRFGFSEGAAGHITARDPERSDCFWVNPIGRNFRQMRVSDLILVNREGEVIHGNQPVNQAAFAIHSAIHEARPDVIAAAHAHSVNGRAWSALGRLLPMHTQDHTMFWNDQVLVVDGGGAIVAEPESGEAMAAQLGNKKAMIHQNHGFITVGASVDAAAWWFIALERAAEVSLKVEAAG
ncbi:MAG: class II aldolase/adducin family protein, partial [Oceanisphaera sp.]|nr:class II aldolase/adducin family protein [Oceanisphaera sp.]